VPKINVVLSMLLAAEYPLLQGQVMTSRVKVWRGKVPGKIHAQSESDFDHGNSANCAVVRLLLSIG
jgi:hypothetical protein